MKRYERMTKEDIISLFGCPCEDCPLYKSRCGTKPCETLKKEWLKEEIKTKKVHRYDLIKSPEDIDRIHKEMYSACAKNGNMCKECAYYDKNDYSSASCFRNFLKEEIEVEE